MPKEYKAELNEKEIAVMLTLVQSIQKNTKPSPQSIRNNYATNLKWVREYLRPAAPRA